MVEETSRMNLEKNREKRSSLTKDQDQKEKIPLVLLIMYQIIIFTFCTIVVSICRPTIDLAQNSIGKAILVSVLVTGAFFMSAIPLAYLEQRRSEDARK